LAEQAQRALDRAKAQHSRGAAEEAKRLLKEAREAHRAAIEAEVQQRNLMLAEIYTEIDSLLASTLDVDDYVDLETLRVAADHPPFDRPELEVPVPLPELTTDPPEPVLVVPAPPKGLARLFRGEKKHAAAVAKAQEVHRRELVEWRAKLQQAEVSRREALEAHSRAEAERAATLEVERARYAQECAAREAEATDRNKQLDDLVANLGYGAPEAVQEYVSIVLSNSVYPEHFVVDHELEYEPSSAELRLRVLVPAPGGIPEVKAYKYTKATDEITATALPQKACRDRYASAVHQVSLRSIHEVFEADRRNLIKTIALTVGTDTCDPATGLHTYVPFVAVGVERQAFLNLNLSAVVPARTLDRLGAAVSKNPYALVAADALGVRRS